MKTWPASDPLLYLGMLMRAVIIHNKVDIKFIGNALVNLLQEDEKFLMPVPLFAACQPKQGTEHAVGKDSDTIRKGGEFP